MRDERMRALATAARTLVGYGHLTSEAISAVESLSARLGLPVRCIVEWNRVVLVDIDGRAHTTVHVRPEAINMARVNATLRAIDSLPASGDIGDRELARLNSRLDEAASISHAPLWLFVLACIAGAWGLALIYGARSPLSYLLIALAAGIGGCMRRWLGAHGIAVPGQALAAAMLAGILGGVADHLGIASAARLVAVCPAMILVPGPHLINGALDVTGKNVTVGWHRLVYGGIILAAISGGLVVGLLLVGSDLPVTAGARTPSLWVDALAAALAAMAFSVYFSMPLTQAAWPILVGGLIHAGRWILMVVCGVNVINGDLAACIVAGLVLSAVAHRKRLSFAGVGFAAIVALVPGIYLFRAVAGMVQLTARPSTVVVVGIAQDFSTALLILAAMTFGLILSHGFITRWRAAVR